MTFSALPSPLQTPLTPPLGVNTPRASGLAFNALCRRTEAVGGMEVLLSKTLLGGVGWTGIVSVLFRGVDLVALARSTSESFLAWVDRERRPAVEVAGSVVV